MIRVLDDVLKDPDGYRKRALALEFGDVTIGPDTFRGIAPCESLELVDAAAASLDAEPILSFFRKSPRGQVEPNYVHTDKDMGAFTGIYYMNPEPPKGDGTKFWEWDDGWRETGKVEAKFNRLLLFSTDQHHSRALYNNYGSGDTARLIQVVFLR